VDGYFNTIERSRNLVPSKAGQIRPKEALARVAHDPDEHELYRRTNRTNRKNRKDRLMKGTSHPL
jgi:hypothetical protein